MGLRKTCDGTKAFSKGRFEHQSLNWVLTLVDSSLTFKTASDTHTAVATVQEKPDTCGSGAEGQGGNQSKQGQGPVSDLQYQSSRMGNA